MVTTAGSSERLFLDANILVYACQLPSPLSDAARQHMVAAANAGCELVISPQILREFLVAATRPRPDGSRPPVDDVLHDAMEFVTTCTVVVESGATLSRLLEIVGSVNVAGKQIHDANVVATMLAYGVRRLLTHNVADFKRYTHLIDVVPLFTA